MLEDGKVEVAADHRRDRQHAVTRLRQPLKPTSDDVAHALGMLARPLEGVDSKPSFGDQQPHDLGDEEGFLRLPLHRVDQVRSRLDSRGQRDEAGDIWSR